MKTILIASASGGSAKTTTAVRLAESLARLRVPAGIVDLSPWPTAQGLVQHPEVFVLRGRSASTPISARSILKPYQERARALLLDSGRLDDPALDPWLPLCSALLLTTRADRFSLSALQGVGDSLARLRRKNPDMEFLGFLPVMVAPGESTGLAELRRAAGGYLLPVSVPADAAEWRKSHASLISGLDESAGSTAAAGDLSGEACDELARHLITRLLIEPLPEEPQPAPPKEIGVMSRLWRMAARTLGPKVTVDA